MYVLKPLRGQFVNVGGIGIRVSVAANPIDVVVFASQPQDVGPVGGRGDREKQKQQHKRPNFASTTPKRNGKPADGITRFSHGISSPVSSVMALAFG
jgi:hypothetical protein